MFTFDLTICTGDGEEMRSNRRGAEQKTRQVNDYPVELDARGPCTDQSDVMSNSDICLS